MCHVADEGYPVPRVHDVDGPDLVMDRLDGPTMGEAMVDDVDGHAATLAELHDQLHSYNRPRGWRGRRHPAHGPAPSERDHDRGRPIRDRLVQRPRREAALDVADTVCVLSAVSADTVPIPAFQPCGTS